MGSTGGCGRVASLIARRERSTRPAGSQRGGRRAAGPAPAHHERARELADEGQPLEPAAEAIEGVAESLRGRRVEEVEGSDLRLREARPPEAAKGPQARERHLVRRDPEVPL